MYSIVNCITFEQKSNLMFTAAAVMQLVREFALHAEGWMFEYRSRPKKQIVAVQLITARQHV